MRTVTSGETAAAARQIVAAMVEPTIHVSVHIDGALIDDHRRSTAFRAVRPAAALVSVEMVGPESAFAQLPKTILATGEAHAWCNDEIVSAARRAAEGIMRKYPAWRRGHDAGRILPMRE